MSRPGYTIDTRAERQSSDLSRKQTATVKRYMRALERYCPHNERVVPNHAYQQNVENDVMSQLFWAEKVRLRFCNSEVNRHLAELNALSAEYRRAMTVYLGLRSYHLDESEPDIVDTQRYYYVKEQLEQSRSRCQRAAADYAEASNAYSLTVKALDDLEDRFDNDGCLDTADGTCQTEAIPMSTWQERLDTANEQVAEAKSRLDECLEEHRKATNLFVPLEETVRELSSRYPREIERAERFFRIEAIGEQCLASIRSKVELKQRQLARATERCDEALRDLDFRHEHMASRQLRLTVGKLLTKQLTSRRPWRSTPADLGSVKATWSLEIDEDSVTVRGGGFRDDLAPRRWSSLPAGLLRISREEADNWHAFLKSLRDTSND